MLPKQKAASEICQGGPAQDLGHFSNCIGGNALAMDMEASISAVSCVPSKLTSSCQITWPVSVLTTLLQGMR